MSASSYTYNLRYHFEFCWQPKIFKTRQLVVKIHNLCPQCYKSLTTGNVYLFV